MEKEERLAFENKWATYKYNLMERNYAYYKDISKQIHNNIATNKIEEALEAYLLEEINLKAVENTFLHIWGYFKKIATDQEKTQFFELLEGLGEGIVSERQVKERLAVLTGHYQVTYLQKSHYFDDLYMENETCIAPLLLEWYYNNKRHLPWRETKEPYKIWLSEIMCQQTQVGTVIDYYHRFLEKWDSFEALARADEDAVLNIWQGLGYYSRALRMMALAKAVVGGCDGKLPDQYHQLVKLPGIGAYTAGAILSICYNQKLPAVDGNVLRVISRLYNIQEDIGNPKNKGLFEHKVKRIIPDDAGDFNQGLMELGATICTPKNPRCEVCPINNQCLARVLRLQDQLPYKQKGRAKKYEKIAVGVVTYMDQLLLIKAGPGGLLGGLFGLPYVVLNENETEAKLLDYLLEDFGVQGALDNQLLVRYKHVFTHKTWEMKLYRIELPLKPVVAYPLNQWVAFNQIDNYPISTAFMKGIKAIAFLQQD